MFKELAPLLAKRSLILTVSSVGDERIRVTITPRPTGKDDVKELSQPFAVEGSAEELDTEPSPCGRFYFWVDTRSKANAALGSIALRLPERQPSVRNPHIGRCPIERGFCSCGVPAAYLTEFPVTGLGRYRHTASSLPSVFNSRGVTV